MVAQHPAPGEPTPAVRRRRPGGYPPPGTTGYSGPAPGGPYPTSQAPYQGYPAAPAYGHPAGPMVTTADGVPLAGWWWRVLAAVIDNVLLSTVVTIIAAPVWLPIYEAFAAYLEAVIEAAQAGAAAPPVMDPNQLIPIRAQVILTALSVGLGMLYHVTFLRWKGATLGKLACRLRVVPVDRGLDPGTAELERGGHPRRGLGAPGDQLAARAVHRGGRAVPAVASQAAGPSRPRREDPGCEANLTGRR